MDSTEDTKKQAESKVSLWELPPTWFGCGVGMIIGSTFGGGDPWYRPALIGLAGLCLAVGMLVHMRRAKAT